MNRLTMYTLLLTFLIFGFANAQITNELRIVGNAEYLSNQLIDNDVRDNNGSICAGLMIVSDISGLTFDSNNGIVKVNSKDGEHLLFLSPTERVVKIYAPGFVPLQIILSDLSVNLKSGQVWQIKITGDKKLDLIPVNVLVDPTDVNIIIDGKSYSSNSPIQLSEGKHTLQITKSGYKSISEEIEVSTIKNLFNYTLEKVNIVLVTVRSNPSGAKIFLNNAEKGTTDDQLFEYPGTYELKLIKPGYLDYQQRVVISEKEKNNFEVSLIKNSGKIIFKVLPNDSEIRINAELQTAKTVELIPGRYQIDISKTGYLSQNETIELKLGETITKKYELIKNSAALTLNVTPSDATVLLNKRDYSKRKTIEIAPGRYQIEVNKEGYYPIEETIEVKLGVPLSLRYNLRQKVGSLQFKIKPIDAHVKLLRNNVEVKNWNGSNIINDIQVGEYNLEAKIIGYKTYRTICTIKENENAIINITMEVGSDLDLPEMVYVEGGTFSMGSNEESDEKPLHSVTISSFYIGKYEVMFEEYDVFCKATGREKPSDRGWGRGKRPVINVSWQDATVYCEWLSKETGNKYRLPTEAEWEYASRGGMHSAQYTYSGSNDIDDVAWYYSNSGSKTDEVGTNQPNELGIYDMSGNVWECCSDWYSDYSSSPSTNPQGPTSGSFRVLRGGSWSSPASFCRSAYRGNGRPTDSNADFGFRIAQDL